jgi:hypothetical protein
MQFVIDAMLWRKEREVCQKMEQRNPKWRDGIHNYDSTDPKSTERQKQMTTQHE